MSLQPGALRLLGGLGAVLMCGGAGVTVAADQRPAGAPLRPPVDHGSAPVAAAARGGRVIPPTRVCSGAPAVAGVAARRPAATPAAVPAATDPRLQAILQQLAQAATPQARRQLLAGLPADQRQQVTALLRQRAASAPPGQGTPAAVKAGGAKAGGAAAGAGASCLGVGGSTGSASGGSPDNGLLVPRVSDAGQSGPAITFTYVS
jgi:hypothetical protein